MEEEGDTTSYIIYIPFVIFPRKMMSNLHDKFDPFVYLYWILTPATGQYGDIFMRTIRKRGQDAFRRTFS